MKKRSARYLSKFCCTADTDGREPVAYAMALESYAEKIKAGGTVSAEFKADIGDDDAYGEGNVPGELHLKHSRRLTRAEFLRLSSFVDGLEYFSA